MNDAHRVVYDVDVNCFFLGPFDDAHSLGHGGRINFCCDLSRFVLCLAPSFTSRLIPRLYNRLTVILCNEWIEWARTVLKVSDLFAFNEVPLTPSVRRPHYRGIVRRVTLAHL